MSPNDSSTRNSSSSLAVKRRTPRTGPVLLVVGLVAIALAWVFAARALLSEGLEREDEASLARSQAAFSYGLTQLTERVRAEVWLMGEDPRLRSALATEGIDERTIVDLLA